MSQQTQGTNFYGDSINGVQIALVDETGAIMEAKWATVPVWGSTWYAKGCEFIKTNGGAGTTLRVNEWTILSSTFTAISGGGGSWITELTGDVTAWPGTGTQAATIAAGAVVASMLGATFPFAGTPATISPTASLSGAPLFTGAALATHSHDLQQSSAEALTVTAGTWVSSAAVNTPIAMVESVYITAGGVTGAVTVIPAGQTPATLECTYNPTTWVFQFLVADAVTAAVVTYVTRAVTSVSAGTPAGTNSTPTVVVTGAAYTPAGTITPA